jgi:hypothetical protein
LHEESGLLRKDIELIEGDVGGDEKFLYFDEISQKGFISSRYFVSTLKKPIDQVKITPMNAEEILSFGFYNMDKARELLKEQRRKVLNAAFLAI